jgi:hypothetical protein
MHVYKNAIPTMYNHGYGKGHFRGKKVDITIPQKSTANVQPTSVRPGLKLNCKTVASYNV